MTKTFTAALTALTLAATLALPSTQAEAKGKGALIGAGLLGAAIVGTAVAASAGPTVVVGPGFRRCRPVPVHDYFGHIVGWTKVCRYY
jgi:hypothetical protein